MERILIAYADEKMKYSLDFLGKQATSLHVFDKIILYTPDDLPIEIKKSPLFQYAKGGGYWVWKPYIIWNTLQNSSDGDTVCYVDAGCLLSKGSDWDKYFSLLNDYDTLCFQYRDNVKECLSIYGLTSTKNKYWTKKYTLDFFDSYLKSRDYRDKNQILCAVIFCKGRNNALIREWYELTLKYPELIIDPIGDEINNQYDYFSGNHRHDQSMVTALAFKHSRNRYDTKILYENFELSHSENEQIIKTARLKNINYKTTYLKFLAKYYFCKFIHVKMKWYGLLLNV